MKICVLFVLCMSVVMVSDRRIGILNTDVCIHVCLCNGL